MLSLFILMLTGCDQAGFAKMKPSSEPFGSEGIAPGDESKADQVLPHLPEDYDPHEATQNLPAAAPPEHSIGDMEIHPTDQGERIPLTTPVTKSVSDVL